MGIFSTENKDDKLIAMFGIGSGSVGGSLVNFTKGPNGDWQPHIIAQARTPISFQQELNFEKFFADMQNALRVTAEKIYNTKKGAPDSIFCTLSSPWYVSETRTVHFEKPTPFLVTKKILDDLVTRELTDVTQSFKIRYEGIDATPRLLENKILHSALNGYTVTDPIGKRASTVDMNLLISVSPDMCIDGIKETLQKVFHDIPVSYGSFMASLFIAARDRYMSSNSYLLMDINGEVTDIGIVSDGIITTTISFPLGKNYIIRTLVAGFGKNEDESRSAFRMMVAGTLEASVSEKLSELLLPIKKEWTRLFENSVTALPKTISLPTTIFLVSDDDLASWFGSILRAEDYTPYMIKDKKFTVITIEGPTLLDICKITDGTCDQFTMVEAIALGRMLSS